MKTIGEEIIIRLGSKASRKEWQYFDEDTDMKFIGMGGNHYLFDFRIRANGLTMRYRDTMEHLIYLVWVKKNREVEDYNDKIIVKRVEHLKEAKKRLSKKYNDTVVVDHNPSDPYSWIVHVVENNDIVYKTEMKDIITEYKEGNI